MKRSAFLVRIGLAVVAGAVIALWMAQHDPRFRHALEKRITASLERMLDCKLSGTLTVLNLFNPTFVVKNASAQSKIPGQWQWRCKKCTVQFSYLELLGLGKLAVNMHLDNLEALTLYQDGKAYITDHLQRMVAYQKEMPLSLKKLLITNGRFSGHTASQDDTLQIAFKSEAGTIGNRFKATMYVTDGSVRTKQQAIAQDIQGTLGLDMKHEDKSSRLVAFTDMHLVLPQLSADDQRCSLRATWKDRAGKIWLCNKQGTFAIKQADVHISPRGQLFADMRAQFPLSYWYSLLTGQQPDDAVQGNCTLTARVAQGADKKVDAALHITRCGWRSLSLDHVQGDLRYANGTWQAVVHVHDALLGKLQGTGSWHEDTQQGSLNLENRTRIQLPGLPYWYVLPHDIQVNGQLAGTDKLKGSFHAIAHHEKVESQAKVSGNLQLDGTQFLLTGSVNDKPYVMDISLAPEFSINKVLFTDHTGQPLVRIGTEADEHTTLQGTLTYPFLRLLLLNSIGYDIKGQGDIKVKAALKDNQLFGQLWLPDGNIRLASTYNFIHKARIPVRFDITNKELLITDAKLALHKGTILCKRAKVQCNDAGRVVYAHVPILLNKVFLNVGKDIFAVVSGYVVLIWQKGKIPMMRGNVVIERAQVKRNILSGTVQRNLLRELSNSLLGSDADVGFDVRVTNRHALQVKTSFLQTDLDMDLHCTGRFSTPRVTGTISLSNGTLQFPYRPLHVVNGVLRFTPHQLEDPRIQLTATGNIKRYTVTMHVGGTVQHPSINFSSSPTLSEEQIITLLLAGSEEGSLSLVMPSLIMQNVQNLIFGSEHGSSTVETYVNNVLAPFKHIRIVPSFSDQTGRGGFRGAIEIDVSERLHAVIQKNFSLTEDTRVEVEYRLSDDINIRGIKDERGDLGGEIETRFSF